jgi:hypothetical protein
VFSASGEVLHTMGDGRFSGFTGIAIHHDGGTVFAQTCYDDDADDEKCVVFT